MVNGAFDITCLTHKCDKYFAGVAPQMATNNVAWWLQDDIVPLQQKGRAATE